MITITRRVVLGLLGVGSAVLASLASIAPAHAATPRYTVAITSMTAVDETAAIDFTGSDQVYGGFELLKNGGRVTPGFRSQLLTSFDTGNVKSLAPDKNCLWPSEYFDTSSGHGFLDAQFGDRWGCIRSNGVSAPFGLRSALYESVSCPPQTPTCFTPDYKTFPLSKMKGTDTGMGTRELHFSEQGLALDLPTVGSSRSYSITHTGGGGHYRVTVTVARVA